jgi:3-isopropylmalate dehydrogenase
MRDTFDILLLPGDGIGPEVVGAAREVMDAAADHFGVRLSYEEREIGAAAIRDEGEPISEETLEAARASDSVLLGAVGHPDFDRGTVRPEAGLLELRKRLGAFANLRPVAAIPSLLSASTLKEEVLKGVNILIIRELRTSGRRRRARSARAISPSTRARRSRGSRGWRSRPRRSAREG